MAKHRTEPSPRNAQKKAAKKSQKKAAKKEAAKQAKVRPMSGTKFHMIPDDHEFNALRGRAIQAYAGLESSLCGFFSELTGMARQASPIVFYKITNAKVVVEILQDLLTLKNQSEYAAFWSSLKKMLHQVIQQRNEIVHWTTVGFLGAAPGRPKTILMKTASLASFRPTPADQNADAVAEAIANQQITPTQIVNFTNKVLFLAHLCSMFTMEVSGVLSGPTDQSWREIFQKPIEYPPPKGHPLNTSPETPERQPPASQE